MAIGRLLRGETAARAVPPRMPSPLGSQGGIQGGRRRGYRARGARYRAGGKIIRHIAGHTEAIDAAKRAGDYYSLYRVEGSAFGDFSCYRVGHAPYNGTLYLPAGFHDYGIATVDELFVALVVGRCEFLCEYQDEIDEVYHGLFEKRI